jgi:hypothetical protein
MATRRIDPRQGRRSHAVRLVDMLPSERIRFRRYIRKGRPHHDLANTCTTSSNRLIFACCLDLEPAPTVPMENLGSTRADIALLDLFDY